MKGLSKIKQIIIIIFSHISIKTSSKLLYYWIKKEKLNLKKPKKFNEKLMYLKLYDYNHNKQVFKCADKYCMREYVTRKLGNENNLVKLYGVYNKAEEIEWDKFPNKFVIKCTHGCGFNIVCTDKEKFDTTLAEKKLNKWLKTKFGYKTAETHYTHIKPKIICEKFIESQSTLPVDYKFYCFDGIAKVVLVCSDRDTNRKADFFDMDWKELKLRDNNTNTTNAQTKLKKPDSFSKMIEYAEILSKDFKFVRVDFYEENDKPIISELTFTPAACLGYYSKEGDKYLSDLYKF